MKVNTSKVFRFTPYIIFFALFLVIANPLNIFNYSKISINPKEDNSMHPTYKNGDLLIIQPMAAKHIKIGHVIVYKTIEEINVIHRVQDVQIINDQHYFRCKGDNFDLNPNLDRPGFAGTLIPYNQVEGVVVGHVPLVGNLYSVLSTNIEIRNFILFLIGIASIFNVLGPNVFYFKTKQKEEKIVEINREIIKTKIKNTPLYIKHFLMSIPNKLRTRTYQLIILIIAIILILSLLIPLIFFENHNENTHINSIRIGEQQRSGDSMGGEFHSYTYYRVDISIYDSGRIGEKIDFVTVEVKDQKETLLARNKWTPITNSVSGIYTISFSMVLSGSKLPSDPTDLRIYVRIHISQFGVDGMIDDPIWQDNVPYIP